CSVGDALGRGPVFESRQGGWTGGCHAVRPSCLLAVRHPGIRCAAVHTLRSPGQYACATYALVRNRITLFGGSEVSRKRRVGGYVTMAVMHSRPTTGGLQMASLLVLAGANRGQTYTLSGDSTTIGSNSDCEVVINFIGVSRKHAIIRRIDGTFLIED